MKINNDVLKGYIYSLLCSLIFGGNLVAGRFITNLVPSVTLSAFRSFSGLLVLLPFVYVQLRKDTRPKKQDVGYFALLGFLGIAMPYLSILLALHYSSVTKTSIFLSTIPAVTNLLLALVWRVKLSVRTWLGIIVSFLGLFFVFNHGSLVNFQNLQWNWGDLWLIINVLSIVMFSILAQRAMTKFSAQTVIIYSLFFGTVFLVPYGFWQALGADWHLSTASWLTIMYMSFVVSGFAALLNVFGIKLLGSGNAAIFSNLMPVFGIIFGVVLLKETLAYYHLIGIILVLGGVTLSLYGNTKESAFLEAPVKRTLP